MQLRFKTKKTTLLQTVFVLLAISFWLLAVSISLYYIPMSLAPASARARFRTRALRIFQDLPLIAIIQLLTEALSHEPLRTSPDFAKLSTVLRTVKQKRPPFTDSPFV